MSWFGRRERVAVAVGADRLRLVVAQGNGTLKVTHIADVELPEGALRPGLKSPNIADRAVVLPAFRQMVATARDRGFAKHPELVALVLSDATAKVASAPLEGGVPNHREGEVMARWVLRDLLPLDEGDARVDWAVLSGQPLADAATDGAAIADPAPTDWLLSIGSQAALIDEYEGLLGEVGWTVGRVVPWTLAASAAVSHASSGARSGGGRDGMNGLPRESAGSSTRRLILCDADGSLACMVEADDVPRFHRSWRARVPAARLGQELPSLQRFIAERLEMSVDDVWVCGSDDWSAAAIECCDGLGWSARRFDHTDALLGALRG